MTRHPNTFDPILSYYWQSLIIWFCFIFTDTPGPSLFRQVIGIPAGMNCAPLLADLFLNSNES